MHVLDKLFQALLVVFLAVNSVWMNQQHNTSRKKVKLCGSVHEAPLESAKITSVVCDGAMGKIE